MKVFAELVRRNIFRVALLYVASAWLVLEILSLGVDYAGLPSWIYRFAVALGIICFPLAMVFSWLFEITPEGLVRETKVEPSRSITVRTGRKLLRLAILCVLGVAGLNLLRFGLDAWIG
ncbi:hypothetical protein F3N42_02530 [Marinihelvus fidelis]|uniref:Adenylyl cyclase n=1 Tax=Marinihelvus fidelis TaxID=2613842 RepID=A0A5N0TF59_9GAMM|nr:hypothetical protein [Marinihelvus fidelis]KAA9133251.1 hypothetical protein F3N42_02530 [Marinihelvus fidelis]